MADSRTRATWAAEPLDEILNGNVKRPTPTLMQRTDGVSLLYQAKVHSLHGESESAKSLIAQAECVRVLESGGRVLFMDFESDPISVVSRLLSMGATAVMIRKGFTYVRPEFDPESFGEAELDAFERHLAKRYTLAVIDGVTASFSVYGLNSMDNGDTMKWGLKLPLKLASATGAAVLVIDHVTKSSDGRGRFAIGAQMKMAFLTGAAFTAKMTQQLGVGRVGTVEIRVGKDREGMVRSHSSDFRSSDQTAAIAMAVFDSTEKDRLHYSLEPPGGEAAGTRGDSVVMAIIEYLADGRRRSKNDIEKAMKSAGHPRDRVRTALRNAQESGAVSFGPGPRNSIQLWVDEAPEPSPGTLVVTVDFSQFPDDPSPRRTA